MTPEKAQIMHDARKAGDPEHDRVSCWCCCWSCGFEQDEAGDVTSENAS